MALIDELARNGDWLYRWRSYLPLILIGILFPGMMGFAYPANSELIEHIWEGICLAVSFCGLGIRVYVIGHAPRGTSGRNTGKQEADSLNTTGLYSVVRHPLYLGNFLIWTGISMFAHQWWVTTISTLIFWLYYERIMAAEEQFLRKEFGDQFEKWAMSTPAFLPKMTGWKNPPSSFSLKSVLRREYSGFTAIIVILGALNAITHFLVEGRIEMDPFWSILTTLGILLYVILRTLKRNTTLLNPPPLNIDQP